MACPSDNLVPLGLRGRRHPDQVPRLDAFKQAHPEVTVTPPPEPLRLGPRGRWTAAIPDADAVEHVTRWELADLLDVLEERFPVPPP
jgi:hypothetical protein